MGLTTGWDTQPSAGQKSAGKSYSAKQLLRKPSPQTKAREQKTALANSPQSLAACARQ